MILTFSLTNLCLMLKGFQDVSEAFIFCIWGQRGPLWWQWHGWARKEGDVAFAAVASTEHGVQSLDQRGGEGQPGSQFGDVPSYALSCIWRALITAGIRGRVYSAMVPALAMLQAAATSAERQSLNTPAFQYPTWCQFPLTPSHHQVTDRFASLCRRETHGEHGVQHKVSTTLSAASEHCVGRGG